MGTNFGQVEFSKSTSAELIQIEKKVVYLAVSAARLLRGIELSSFQFSHFIAVTSVPDRLAPALSQEIRAVLSLRDCLTIDMVQGCSGSVSGLILACQLCEAFRSQVLVIMADAAREAVSSSLSISKHFGNAGVAFIIDGTDANSKTGLIDSFSRQETSLTELVTIGTGHQVVDIIKENMNSQAFKDDPKVSIGFQLSDRLAARMVRPLRNAFFEAQKRGWSPDIIISHNANPRVMRKIMKSQPFVNAEVVDLTAEKNTGVATIGIGLHAVFESCQSKKVMMIGFGTGGAIVCGYWQF